MRLFILLLSFFISAQSFAVSISLDLFQNNSKASSVTITQSQYVVSGVAELIVGFGIGHAVQGRYVNRGWFFTAAPLLVYFVGLGISSLVDGGHKSGLSYEVNRVSLSLVTALRVWGIIDAWMLPNHYKVKKDNMKFRSHTFSHNNSIALDLLSYRW